MKVLFVNNSYPLHPRTKKIAKIFGAEMMERSNIHYCAWDRRRDARADHENNVHVFKTAIGYGNRLQKFRYIFGYMRFIRQQIRIIAPDIIVCRYFDMYFLVCLMSFISGRVRIIYDVCDMPNSVFMRLFDYIITSLRRHDIILLASRYFAERYPDRAIVLENMVDEQYTLDIADTEIFRDEGLPMKLSFIGGIRYMPVFQCLVDVMKELSDLELHFYGGGPDEDSLISYARGIKNIFFHGPYEYRDIANIYFDSDVIWAAYPAFSRNVRYAISNKFYESLVFERPGIYAFNTALGALVDKNDIGFVVDPLNRDDIRKLLMRLQSNKAMRAQIVSSIRTWKTNNPVFWQDQRESFSKINSQIMQAVCA